MAKSIESMWKQGFLSEESLSAPKINDLYGRKSQNIVDKLQRMFAINIKAIVIGSVIMLIMMTLIGAPFLGVYMCCLLAPLVYIAQKELNKTNGLSKGQSSYDYLMNFNNWLQSSIKTYAKYYQYFYPLLFLGMAIQALTSKAGGKIVDLLLLKLPTSWVILGQPYYLIIAIVVVTLLMIKYADALYRLDLNIVYGRQFKKLKELIADMEELRNG